MSIIKYRADIDGLRALAIVPVVLYHLGFATFSGGFVGVDIFFVISGFLICSIIYREMQLGRFSIIDFWERRARRILPAMLVLIVATLVAGWFLLAPHDLYDLGRSARYQALFAANIFFWQEAGYFDGAAESKPLLHMWSLAVEEQFYLFFPLMLLLLSRLPAGGKMLALLLLGLASLALSQWSVSRYPDATFYLLHTRAWELLAGGLLVFLAPPPATAGAARQWSAVAGLLMILFSVFAYDHNTVFPGLSAVLPVLGTVLIIYAGPAARVNRLLALKPLVWIGLISYSWYLWHWPMIVYARYWLADDYALLHQLLLLFAGLLLAIVSWRWVETPFRKRQLCASRRRIFTLSLVCLLLLVAVGQQIRRADGYPQRLSAEARQYEASRHRSERQKRCDLVLAEQVNDDRLCRLGNTPEGQAPRFLAWGDSHTMSLLPLYDRISEQHQLAGWYASHIACPPVLGLQWHNKPQCNAFNEAMLALLQRHDIQHVILAGRWAVYLYGAEDGDRRSEFVSPDGVDRLAHYAAQIGETVARIRQQGATVWLVRQVPLQAQHAPQYLSLRAMQGKPTAGIGRPYAEHMARQQAINTVLDALAAEDDGVRLLDPAAILCADRQTCRMEADGYALYRDPDHLSPAGAFYLQPMLLPLLQALATPQP
ncbi:MAG TPA: acyltransferase family protein [Pseudomonadales bacterium]